MIREIEQRQKDPEPTVCICFPTKFIHIFWARIKILDCEIFGKKKIARLIIDFLIHSQRNRFSCEKISILKKKSSFSIE